MADASEVVVLEVDRDRDVLRACFSDFRGVRYASIRSWVEPRTEPGTLIPSRNGINIPVGDLPLLRELLEGLEAAAAADQAPARSRR